MITDTSVTNTTDTFFSESLSSCRDCRPSSRISQKYPNVRCPRIPKTKRSGNGKKSYANRIWLAVEQSKKTTEKKWKHVRFSRNSFSGHFDHDDEGKLTAKGARDLKFFLTLLDTEDRETYEKTFPLTLSNPFRGLNTTLVGASACSFRLVNPFEPFSNEHLSELIELYLMNEVETLSFIDYNPETLSVVFENLKEIQNGLAYTARDNETPWSEENVFRCLSQKYPLPYLSQFWFYDSSQGSGAMRVASDPGSDQNSLNKWGFSLGQAASMVNGKTSEDGVSGDETIKPELRRFSFEKYLTNGFQLGMVDTNVCELFQKVTGQLEVMSLKSNILRDDYFETTKNCLGFVIENARNISSYWQWFVHRRLTPVEAGIILHRKVTSGEELPSWLLEFTSFLDQVSEKNDDYLNCYPSPQKVHGAVENADDTYTFLDPQYTLAVSSRDGGVDEPSYPNSRAVQTGAAVTFIKFMIQTSTPLQEIQADQNQRLFPIKTQNTFCVPIIQAKAANELSVVACDDRTVTDELNKFAENIAMSQCWAGKGLASDVAEGLYLGEQISLRICSDLLASWYQDEYAEGQTRRPSAKLTLLNGNDFTVIPSSSYRE